MVKKVIALLVSRASHSAGIGQDANVSTVMAFSQRKKAKASFLRLLENSLKLSFPKGVFPEGRLYHRVPGSEVSLEDCL